MYIFFTIFLFPVLFFGVLHTQISSLKTPAKKLIIEKPTLKNAPFHRSAQTDIPSK